MSEWISVKDRLPVGPCLVLAYRAPSRFKANTDPNFEGTSSRYCVSYFGTKFRGYITHWMPLPDPPAPSQPTGEPSE